jgi:hypothetical protein
VVVTKPTHLQRTSQHEALQRLNRCSGCDIVRLLRASRPRLWGRGSESCASQSMANLAQADGQAGPNEGLQVTATTEAFDEAAGSRAGGRA